MSTLLDPLKAALPPFASDAPKAAEFDDDDDDNNPRHPQPHAYDNADDLIADLTTNPGLNPTHFDAGNRYEDSDDDEEGEHQRKSRRGLHRVTGVIAHPVRTIKDRSNKRAAAKVAAARPVVPKGNDRAFLEAQRRVEGRDDGAVEGDDGGGGGGLEAERTRTGNGEGDADEAHQDGDEAQEEDVRRLNELMGERDSLRVAWTMDEGVMRAVAVDRRRRALPTVREFERVDGDGNEEVQWGKFAGAYLLNASWPYTSPYVDEFGEVPFETDILRRHVHRLLICSAPLQKWMVSLRAVYRWDDPYHTLGWVVLYAFLIGIDRVATFFLGWILWHLVRNGMYPSRPNESKNAIERKLDPRQKPTTVAELIDQCAQDDWLFPLLDMLGPMMQLQLNDAADFLEILDNFYQWKNPLATFRITCLLAGGLVAFNVFSVAFLLRCTWAILGLLFFGLWPIASLHPQYRFLVSPARWAFWGVPTHALWSITQLQVHAGRVKRGLREKAAAGWEDGYDGVSVPDQPGLPRVDLASFSCILRNELASRHPGKLVISTAGVRFQSGLGAKAGQVKAEKEVASEITYARLVEVCKKQAKAKQAVPVNVLTRLLNSMEIAYLVDDEGQAVGRRTMVLQNFRGRDRAFNLILAFSGLEWKTLQPYTDE